MVWVWLLAGIIAGAALLLGAGWLLAWLYSRTR